MDKISIKGNEYSVEVNWRCICAFLEYKHCNDMSCFKDMSIMDWSALMVLAIEEGERLEGRTVEIAEEIMTLRPVEAKEVIERFTEIYVAQSVPKTPEEPKKD